MEQTEQKKRSLPQTDLAGSAKPSTKISELRALLKEKFASAHREPPAVRECIETGVDWLDREGLPEGGICEIFSGGNNSHAGGGVAFHRMLTHAIRKRHHLVLIDGADAFDPASHPVFFHEERVAQIDATLLWARCRSVPEAIKVTDLVVRDANLPRVVLDLQLCDLKEVRRVASSSWFRLRSQVEENGGTLIAFTPAPVIPSATLRFEMSDSFGLEDCESPESQWTGKLRAKVVRDRVIGADGESGSDGSRRIRGTKTSRGGGGDLSLAS